MYLAFILFFYLPCFFVWEVRFLDDKFSILVLRWQKIMSFQKFSGLQLLTLSAMGGGQMDPHFFEHLSRPNGQAKVAEIFYFSYLFVD